MPQLYSPNKYTNITTADTFKIHTVPCILERIVVNSTAAGTIAIYDNDSASGNLIGTLKASVGEGSYEYNCRCTTGLTIVTGAASNITVVSRE